MFRVLSAAGTVLLFALAYAACPYITIWQLDHAVTARNESALEALVDWPSLRAGLEEDLEGLFDHPDPESDDPMDQLAGDLLGIFSDFLIDPVVDFYSTPEGLIYLLNTQVILEDPGEALEEDFPAEETWFDNIEAAGFMGLTGFRVTLAAPEGSAKAEGGAEAMTLDFRLQGVRWQLVRVNLPLSHIAE